MIEIAFYYKMIPVKNTAVAPLTSFTTIADTLESYPETIAVFLSHQMICVGCSMANFDTLEEAARNYSIPLVQLLEELLHQIETDRASQ